MHKQIFYLTVSLFFLLCLPVLVFAEESITITTYYPSPYGSYNELYVASKLGIGTTVPARILSVQYPYSKTDTANREVMVLKSNDTANAHELLISSTGAAAEANRIWRFQTGEDAISNAGNLALQPSGGNVGIGTTGPGRGTSYRFDVATPNAKASDTGDYAAFFGSSDASNPEGLVIYIRNSPTATVRYAMLQAGTPDTSTALRNLILQGNGGNVGIGTTNPGGGSSSNILSIANTGISPTANAGMTHLYSSGGEGFWMDGAGNITQQTPHDPETGEWIFYSKNTRTGRVVRVNMEQLVKAVEEVTGKKFMFESQEF